VNEVQNGVLFVSAGSGVLAIPFTGLAALPAAQRLWWRSAGGGSDLVLYGIRWLDRGRGKLRGVADWGGLHGGLSLALALALPLADGRTWILATTYIVGCFRWCCRAIHGPVSARFQPARTHPPHRTSRKSCNGWSSPSGRRCRNGRLSVVRENFWRQNEDQGRYIHSGSGRRAIVLALR